MTRALAGNVRSRVTSGRREIIGVGTTMVASIIALLPGFALPFAATYSLSAAAASSFLLAYSVCTSVNGVSGAAIELNAISRVGFLRSRCEHPSALALARLGIDSLSFTTCIAVLGGPLLALIFLTRLDEPSQFIHTLVLLTPMPILFSISNTLSGTLIAFGKTPNVVIVQGLRSIPPVAIMLCMSAPTISLIALSFSVGELARFIVLLVMVRRAFAKSGSRTSHARISTAGVSWQAGSTAVAQVGPATDRAFMAGSGPDQIVAYEIADRISTASLQFLNTGVLTREVGKWSVLKTSQRDDVSKMLAGVLRLFVLATAVGSTGVVALVTMNACDLIPNSWRLGVWWATLLLVSLPCAIGASGTNRILVLAQMQRMLLQFVVCGLVIGVALKFALYSSIGTIGIILATVISRYIMFLIQFYMVYRILDGRSGCSSSQ